MWSLSSHPTDGFNLAYNKIENINNRIFEPGKSVTGLMKIKLIKKINYKKETQLLELQG